MGALHSQQSQSVPTVAVVMRWLPLPAHTPQGGVGRGAKRPWGLSGCFCRGKLPVEFGGCGEPEPGVSDVNQQECDPAG